MARLVYRGGSASDDNFTPRLEFDTVGQPGQAPGLSTYSTLEGAAKPGQKAQVIDLDLLESPLHGFPDNPDLEGGEAGHVSIAPMAPGGAVDHELLREWTTARKSGRTHRLTDLLRRALVQENRKRPR